MKKIYSLLLVSLLFNVAILAIVFYPLPNDDGFQPVEIYHYAPDFQKE